MNRKGTADALGIALWLLVLVPLSLLALRPESSSVNDPVVYPDAATVDQQDDYHGETVADPYRWLEDAASADSQTWLRAQNRLTARYVGSLPGRDHFASRLRALIDYERLGVPDREGDTYAYTWNPGQAEQDAIRVTTDPLEPGRVLVDPVAIRADGTVSLGRYKLSPDGSLLAYSLSDGGSDWRTWHVRHVADGRDEQEVLRGVKFSGVSWSRDGEGFYYSRYPRDGAGNHDDSRQVAIYYHRVGTAQENDLPIYAITDHPTREPYGQVTDDGRYLVITVQDGFVTNGVYYRRLPSANAASSTGLDEGAGTVRLLDTWDARYQFLGADGDVFYFLTTRDAPLGRIVAIPLATPSPADWLEMVPEAAEAIEGATLIGGRLVVRYIRDAHARVRVFDLHGQPAYDLDLPGHGTVAGFTGSATNPETFFAYTDFTTPRAIYRLDVRSGETVPVRSAAAAVDPARYVSEQVFYKSRDGTRVPMYIVRRSDVVADGRRPTVLYGYGGFNVSLLPSWSASRMAWIEAGGVYVQANLRGGGEYGNAWHEAGTRLDKQNVFDDFIAAAETLVESGWTSPEHLAIWGGSNGGLLVGAVLNQRPELFAAAVPAVGVLDMLRYHTASLNARKWSSDYGLSENPDEYRALRAYSPYHNLREDVCYPAVLVQADANDDRVAAWHSYKYAAALQAAQSRVRGCSRPVLIRIETRSGHGAGASVSKIVNEYADQWTFVAAATGLVVER